MDANTTRRPASGVTVTRYALATTSALYAHALAQCTQPSATEDEAKAKTWASAAGARAAAKRHSLTNVTPVAVTRPRGRR